MRAWLFAMLGSVGGCWTQASTPASPAVATGTAAAASTPSVSARALASHLEDELGDRSEAMFIDRYIERQLVIVDLQHGAVEVLCDAHTLAVAARIGDLLSDPDRPPVECGSGSNQTVTCTQAGGAAMLWLDFRRHADTWRLLGGILPRDPGPSRHDARPLIREYRRKRDAVVCPP